MFQDRSRLKSALLPLAGIWLAAHAVLLVAILSLKFLTAKTILLVLLLGTAAWFLFRPVRRLLPPPGMV